jgi:hypothetical protein
MRLAIAAVLAAAVSTGSFALQVPIQDPPLPIPGGQRPSANGKDAVQFLSPTQVTLAAGHPAEIDLHFQIAPGLHINSHAPREKTLIPTRLAVIEQGGLSVSKVDFPPGSDYALAQAPQDKLSVYTGSFILRAHITARAGDHMLEGALHYQACDVNSCMPPQSLPLEVSILAK